MGKWNKLGGRGGRGGGGGSGEEHMEGVKGEEEETAGCSFALWRAVLNVIVSEEIFFFFFSVRAKMWSMWSAGIHASSLRASCVYLTFPAGVGF